MKFKSFLLTIGVVAVALVSIHGVTSAQEGCRDITLANGTKVTCVIVNGQKVYADANGNVYNVNSSGNATFQATVNKNCVQYLTPISVSATGTDPVLGTVTTTLDATRVPAASTLASAQAATTFPALSTISFYANATLSSKPGVNYRSVQPITLNGVVNSFNPFNNESFRTTAPVDFEDVNTPGTVAFTLRSLSVTLN